jgi:ELWxxDGT repeat protein
LWTYDGVNEQRVRDLNEGGRFGTILGLADARGTAIILRQGRSLEIWQTNGNPEGTHLLMESTQVNVTDTFRVEFATLGNTFYFVASDRTHGCELWRLDGANGTEVLEIHPDETNPSCPQELTVVADRLFFTADDFVHGRELWVVNGNEPRTPGDSNNDGKFSSSDLVLVFQVGKYESGAAATFDEGDWNGDGVFGTSDLVLAFQAGKYETAAIPAVVDSVFRSRATDELSPRKRGIQVKDFALDSVEST